MKFKDEIQGKNVYANVDSIGMKPNLQVKICQNKDINNLFTLEIHKGSKWHHNNLPLAVLDFLDNITYSAD